MYLKSIPVIAKSLYSKLCTDWSPAFLLANRTWKNTENTTAETPKISLIKSYMVYLSSLDTHSTEYKQQYQRGSIQMEVSTLQESVTGIKAVKT